MRWYLFSIVLCSFLLTGCENEKKPLEGLRLSVVDFDQHVHVDPEISHHVVTLPSPRSLANWSQVGGHSSHVIENPALGSSWARLWESSVGVGTTSTVRSVNAPIISSDVIYVMDNEQDVVALDLNSGRELWRTNVAPHEQSAALYGGGVAVEDGVVLVGSPLAEVVALKAQTGEVMWRQRTASPVRAAPTVADGQVYILTLNNHLYVYDIHTGELLWSHTGITEHAGLLGMSSSAVSGGVVVVAYSSGEIQALKVENGYELWNANLSAIRRPDSLAHMTHIKAQPVIHKGRVYVLGYNQRFACFDLSTGERIWERHIGGVNMPAVVGDYIYVLSNESELVCLLAKTGQVVWVKTLSKDPDNPRKVMWKGPLVADNKVFVFSTVGKVMSFSALSGGVANEKDMFAMSTIPAIANEKMVLLTNSGRVVVYH